MSDIGNDDPNYDGQGKSRQEEVYGSMMVAGCLFLALLMGLLLALTVIVLVVVL